MCQRNCHARMTLIDTSKIMVEEQGIRLPPNIHEQCPEELKNALISFKAWFRSEQEKSGEDGLVLRSTMPTKIHESFELIKKSEIPGYPGILFEDSRYVRVVEKLLV